MDLVRDLLDKLLIDRNGREIGRADALLIEVRPDNPPRVAAVARGPLVLASRIVPSWAEWRPGHDSIPFSDIIDRRHAEIKVDRTASELQAATPRELRLDRLLGRRVLGLNHRPVGRLEEFRAEVHGRGCVITEYVIGTAGFFERMGLQMLFPDHRRRGHVARWDQLDISDPERPTLTCSLDELGKL
jgi:hypothetical protein